jgi:anaerobic selenocysteine-containing dehydrogenase
MTVALPLVESGQVRGACPHDCPDTCATIVTVEDGRAVRIQGDPEHPFTQGFLCAKVNRYLERTYHPDRVLFPMRRVGPKGSGKFERVTWGEALTEIASRLRAIADVHGGEAILPYSYAGTMGYLQGESMDRRFFHRLGASRLDRTICSTAGAAGMRMTLGGSIGADAESIPDTQLVILWGTNTLTSNPHLWPFVLRARERGTPVVCIDPIRTRTAEQCDEWIGIRPGTDAALALGMMHVIFAEALEDRDYMERFTLGHEALRARAAEWTPERASATCGIDAETIVSLARRYAGARAAFVRINYGLQRHAGGGMAVRTIACLPAVVGHWRHPGGGVQLSTSLNFRFNTAALWRSDLSPNVRTINMIRLGEALTKPDAGVGGPPVHALVVYNSNPGAVAPDRPTVRAGLARDDLFTVVLEHFQTDTADWADFVLPATTQLEHWDVHLAYGHHYASLNRPAIAPLGEALPNTEIFRRLAHAMGFADACFADDDLTLIRQALDTRHPRMETVTFEALLAQGWVRLNVPRPYAPFAEGGFETPSGKCEFYSERLAAMGFDPLPTYIPPYESVERDPQLVARFPLTLISSPAHQFLNSTFVNLDTLRRSVGKSRPECIIHPHDAAPRGISTGDLVEIHNDRGAFRAAARVHDGIRAGVLWAPSIWWTKLSPDRRNANDTTSQRETDLGGGATFYDNQVDIRSVTSA